MEFCLSHKFLVKKPGGEWTSTLENQEEEVCFIAGVEEDLDLTVQP